MKTSSLIQLILTMPEFYSKLLVLHDQKRIFNLIDFTHRMPLWWHYLNLCFIVVCLQQRFTFAFPLLTQKMNVCVLLNELKTDHPTLRVCINEYKTKICFIHSLIILQRGRYTCVVIVFIKKYL